MSKIRFSLTRLVKLENEHCGDPEGVAKAAGARVDLEWFIEGELEKLFSAIPSKQLIEPFVAARTEDGI